MSLALRIGGGAVAAALTAWLTIAWIFGFDADSARESWALVAVLAAPAGLGTYALIEYVQTRRLDSITRQLEVRVLALMPVAVAVNIVLGTAVASALKIPVYLDSIGTILVAALGGPLAGALTGLLSNTVWTYLAPPPFQSFYAAPFAIVAVVIGLLAGGFARWGWLRPRPGASDRQVAAAAFVAVGVVIVMALLALRGWEAIGQGTSLTPSVDPGSLPEATDPTILLGLGWLAAGLVLGTAIALLVLLVRRRDLAAAYVVVAGVITGLVAAFVAAPIAANLFGGVTGSGTDFLVAAFRQGGADIGAAVLGQSLISDPIDKVTSYFVAYLVLGALSARVVARFPQGEHLVPVSSTRAELVTAEPAPGTPEVPH